MTREVTQRPEKPVGGDHAGQACHEPAAADAPLRVISETVPGAVLYQSVTAPDGTVRYPYISAGVAHVFGLTADNVMADATAFRQLLVDDDRPQLAAAEQEALQGAKPLDGEWRWRTISGDLKWIHVRATGHRCEGGAIVWRGALLDITARKQLEAEAADQQLRLSMALEAAGMVTWEWDIATRAVRYSAELRDVVRGTAVARYCSLETLLPEIHPDDRTRLTRALERTMTEGRPFACEYRARMLDGTYRWILGQGKRVVVEHGTPVRVLGLSMDITRRKEAEERRRRSEARFCLLADTAARLLATPDPRIVVAPLCREVMAHLDCQVFFHYRVEARPDPTGSDAPGGAPTARLHLATYGGIADAEAQTIEWLDYGEAVCGWVAQAGRCLVVDDIQHGEDPRTALVQRYGVQAYCCHPLLAEGRVLGTLSFGTITRPRFTADEVELMRVVADQVAVAMQRLRTLQAVEAARAEAVTETNRLSAVMDALPVGVCLLDAQGGIVRTNRAYAEIWGGPLPPVDGVRDYAAYRACWVATGTPVQPEEWASARAVQHGETVVNQEFQIQRFDGTRAYVLNSAAPIRDAAGRISGCVTAIRDISDRKEAEEQQRQLNLTLQQAQKEESLGVLAGGIAHDFNNLLTAILANVDLAVGPLHEDARRRLLEHAAGAARRAAALCQQLLAYVGKTPLTFASVHLNPLIQETAHLLAAPLAKHATVRWQLADPLPRVRADASGLRQVIMKLLLNAAEASVTPPGQITVTTGAAARTPEDLQSPWVPEPLPAGNYVYLEVADTGCGMDTAVMNRAFEPFFSTKFTGRGLGLAAVLGIVRSHHGTIHVASTPGRGSTFRVWLPVFAGEAPATEPVAGPTSPWRGAGTILVVDDEETVRLTAQAALAALGFETVGAADGRAAIDLYRADPDRFSCVLLDATMPDLDGEATLQELVRIRAAVRVVLTSGYSKADILARFQGRGLAGFLQKPYRLQDVRAVFEGLGAAREQG